MRRSDARSPSPTSGRAAKARLRGVYAANPRPQPRRDGAIHGPDGAGAAPSPKGRRKKRGKGHKERAASPESLRQLIPQRLTLPPLKQQLGQSDDLEKVARLRRPKASERKAHPDRARPASRGRSGRNIELVAADEIKRMDRAQREQLTEIINSIPREALNEAARQIDSRPSTSTISALRPVSTGRRNRPSTVSASTSSSAAAAGAFPGQPRRSSTAGAAAKPRAEQGPQSKTSPVTAKALRSLRHELAAETIVGTFQERLNRTIAYHFYTWQAMARRLAKEDAIRERARRAKEERLRREALLEHRQRIERRYWRWFLLQRIYTYLRKTTYGKLHFVMRRWTRKVEAFRRAARLKVAVFAQDAFRRRRALAEKAAAEALRQAREEKRRRRKARKAARARAIAAAKRIQIRWRKWRERLRQEQEELERLRNAKATIVQQHARSLLARRHVARVREDKARAEAERQQLARRQVAVATQAHFRGARDRKAFQRAQRAAIKLQGAGRVLLAKREAERRRKAVVQRTELENRSARLIQRRFSEFVARTVESVLRAMVDVAVRGGAADEIQSAYKRRLLARSIYATAQEMKRKRLGAVLAIQFGFRKALLRWHAAEIALQEESALRLQSMIRGTLGRRHAEALRSLLQWAATTIQRARRDSERRILSQRVLGRLAVSKRALRASAFHAFVAVVRKESARREDLLQRGLANHREHVLRNHVWDWHQLVRAEALGRRCRRSATRRAAARFLTLWRQVAVATQCARRMLHRLRDDAFRAWTRAVAQAHNNEIIAAKHDAMATQRRHWRAWKQHWVMGKRGLLSKMRRVLREWTRRSKEWRKRRMVYVVHVWAARRGRLLTLLCCVLCIICVVLFSFFSFLDWVGTCRLVRIVRGTTTTNEYGQSYSRDGSRMPSSVHE